MTSEDIKAQLVIATNVNIAAKAYIDALLVAFDNKPTGVDPAAFQPEFDAFVASANDLNTTLNARPVPTA